MFRLQGDGEAPSGLVYVVEDDDAVRASLCFLLEQCGYTPVQLSSGEELLARMPDLPPGCLLLDVNLPGMSGLELLDRLHAEDCWFPALVTTGMARVDVAVRAFHAGAVEFLTKPVDADTLQTALRGAFATLDGVLAARAARARLSRLSARELQVMQNLCAGMTAKEVARELGISHRTVEVYRQAIYNKLGVGGLAELVSLNLLSAGGR